MPGLDGDPLATASPTRASTSAPTRACGRGDLAEFADAALAGGVDIVQLRDKTADPLEAARRARRAGGARARRAPGTARCSRSTTAPTSRSPPARTSCTSARTTCPSPWARRVVGDGRDRSAARRTAQAETAAAAEEPGVDYFCVGPCWPTPTKPGRPAPGLDLVRTVAGRAPARPWFAIGGIDEARLDEVLAAGAQRVVVVRAITEADDPAAAAARLRASARRTDQRSDRPRLAQRPPDSPARLQRGRPVSRLTRPAQAHRDSRAGPCARRSPAGRPLTTGPRRARRGPWWWGWPSGWGWRSPTASAWPTRGALLRRARLGRRRRGGRRGCRRPPTTARDTPPTDVPGVPAMLEPFTNSNPVTTSMPSRKTIAVAPAHRAHGRGAGGSGRSSTSTPPPAFNRALIRSRVVLSERS